MVHEEKANVNGSLSLFINTDIFCKSYLNKGISKTVFLPGLDWLVEDVNNK